MSDEVTPEDVVKLIELISIDSKSSCRRFRILRCLIKRCFIRHPYLLESFVDINGTEALVNLAHSSRESSKKCGHSIIRLLHNVCCNLEEPLHGIALMIRLCKLLTEEDKTLSRCRVFLADNSPKWVKNDKQTCLQIVTSLFMGVKFDLAKHVKDRELDPSSSKLFPLCIFAHKFELIGEELKDNKVIKKIFDAMLEMMVALLPKYSERTYYDMGKYCKILEVLCSVAVFSGGLQKFQELLASRVNEFRQLVIKCLKFYGNSWLKDNAWVIRYMGLDLDEKLRYAHTILPPINNLVNFRLLINRDKILDDSVFYLMTVELEQLRGNLIVKFIGEPGYGDGPVREWFVLYIEEMLHQNLFVSYSTDKQKILPTRESLDDLYTFTAAGSLIAMALMHKVHLGIKLDRIVHVSFAGREISIEDIKDTDPELYMCWMQYMERKPFNVDIAGVDKEDNQKNNSVSSTDLVQDSFNDFIASISEKISALKLGFDFVTGPRERMNFFREIEPEVVDAFLLGDSKEISVDDWKSHTDTKGYCNSDPQIPWFWKVLANMSPEDKSNLLFFWTSVKFLPPQGFGGLPMRLAIIPGAKEDWLPTSFTCFFQLNLPMYSSYEALEQCLQRITKEHFGFAFQ